MTLGTRQAQQVDEGSFTLKTKKQVLRGDFITVDASQALPVNVAGRYLITKATAAALTLAAPAAADDGMVMEIISNTAAAHTVTATGLYQDGAGHVNLATFAAQIGASMRIMALGGKWFVLAVQGVTMS